MASAEFGLLGGYVFHQQCGSCAKISNSSRTAERTDPLNEFNNAVVITSQPLQDGKPFRVKIDSKVSTWSGSVLIGATTKSPENFRFPPSISGLCNDSWVFNGETIWKDGKKLSTKYGCGNFTSLREGDTVGVMRRGSCLHLFINGVDQGEAEKDLPGENVYALVDLYGRCNKVTVTFMTSGHLTNNFVPVFREALEEEPPPSSNVDALLFHGLCGRMAEVITGGTVAYRKNCEGEFNHSVVLTNRPLMDAELFEVQITRMVDKWAGSIEVGLTIHSPESLDFPSTMTNMHSGTWMMSGNGILYNGDTIREEYSSSLDALKVGDRVGVMRKSDGSLVFFINGRECDVAARDLPRDMYGVVDLYGQCVEVTIINGNTPYTSTNEVSSGDNGGRTQEVALDQPLRLHSVCGMSAEVSADGMRAVRLRPQEEFTKGTVFTNRPLLPEEWFEITTGGGVDCWSGSVQFGVCKLPPEQLNFDEVDEISDVDEAWVLSGMEMIHEGIPSNTDYTLDLDYIPIGSHIAVMVKRCGDLHYALNGVDMGCAAKDIPSGVYGVVDIYGQCTEVTIVNRHDNSEMTTPTPTPVMPTERTAELSSTFDLIPTGRAFHPKCGRNIQLTDNLSVATRVNSYKEAVTFSARPLKGGEVFQIDLVKLDEAWRGQLKIGLTTCNPSRFSVVPSVCTQLPARTWIMSGTTVLVDGHTATENYSRSLSRLQVGNTIGVQRSLEGDMHVYVNDQDLGPAAYEIPEDVYAVVDLYGTACCVKISSTEESAPVNPDDSVLPVVEQTSESSSEDIVTFAPSCGPNIQLGRDCKSARRIMSYSKGIVVSSAPLPNDKLFQVEIKTVEPKWSGSLMIGVTGLPPQQACMAAKASELRGQSYILCASNGATCLFVSGQERQKMQLPESVNLLTLKPGHTVGVLCRSNGIVHFYIDGVHVPPTPHKVPKTRYVVIDLYGQCCEVELKPLTSMAAGRIPLPRNAASPSLQAQPRTKDSSSVSRMQKMEAQKHSEQNGTQGTVVRKVSSGLRKSLPCAYHQLCERFLKSLALPEPYFDRNPEYNKCYCERCASLRGEPQVKFKGSSQLQRKYTVPIGWVKFARRVEARAEVMDVFRQWHVAYHGTTVGNIRHILDCGELMFRGDRTFGNRSVIPPQSHYSESFKPRGFDVNQIFVSPSIKYCSHGEVYASGHRYSDPVTGKDYLAKVALKVRVLPDSYQVIPQTVQPTNGSRLDEHFLNCELEWSTQQRKAIIICGLLVKLEARD